MGRAHPTQSWPNSTPVSLLTVPSIRDIIPDDKAPLSFQPFPTLKDTEIPHTFYICRLVQKKKVIKNELGNDYMEAKPHFLNDKPQIGGYSSFVLAGGFSGIGPLPTLERLMLPSTSIIRPLEQKTIKMYNTKEQKRTQILPKGIVPSMYSLLFPRSLPDYPLTSP